MPLLEVPRFFEDTMSVWRHIDVTVNYPGGSAHGSTQVRYAANLLMGWLRGTFKRKVQSIKVSPDCWLAGIHELLPNGLKTQPATERCAWVAREKLGIDDPAVAEAACMLLVRYLDPGAVGRGSPSLAPRPSEETLAEVRTGLSDDELNDYRVKQEKVVKQQLELFKALFHLRDRLDKRTPWDEFTDPGYGEVVE